MRGRRLSTARDSRPGNRGEFSNEILRFGDLGFSQEFAIEMLEEGGVGSGLPCSGDAEELDATPLQPQSQPTSRHWRTIMHRATVDSVSSNSQFHYGFQATVFGSQFRAFLCRLQFCGFSRIVLFNPVDDWAFACGSLKSP